jgi:tetratricopeptide (TPR) repeat protein
MFSLVPFFLIIVALGVIIVLIIRKFPQLSLLDIDTIPEVIVEKKKNTLLKRRIQKQNARQKNAILSRLQPMFDFFRRVQSKFRAYVGRVERGVHAHVEKKESTEKSKKNIPPREREEGRKTDRQKTEAVLNDAHVAAGEQDWDEAEKKYIAAIRLDAKNKQAYRGLADVYAAQHQYDEALETYRFILQLDPKDDTILARLGDIAGECGNMEDAVNYYQQAVLINPNLSNRFARLADLLYQIQQYDTALEAVEQAVELEPENPKYLDMLTEISIMSGNQERALDAYNRLRMANPDNKKLSAFKDRIDKIA